MDGSCGHNLAVSGAIDHKPVWTWQSTANYIASGQSLTAGRHDTPNTAGSGHVVKLITIHTETKRLDRGRSNRTDFKSLLTLTFVKGRACRTIKLSTKITVFSFLVNGIDKLEEKKVGDRGGVGGGGGGREDWGWGLGGTNIVQLSCSSLSLHELNYLYRE